MTKTNSCSHIRLVARIVALACLSSMVLCYKLWLGERSFPTSPVFNFLPHLEHPFDYILPGIAALLLIIISIHRNPQHYIALFVLVAIALLLFDLNRWQPWFYQYGLMFFVLAFFNFRCDDSKQQNSIVIAFKIMVAAVYFWSGLQKLNPHFLSDTFPWIMEPITRYLPDNSITHFKFLGYSFPLIEAATGVCLLIPSLQKLAAISAILMHVFILFILSPLGHNYNPVVWPWNIAMILFVVLLFYNEVEYSSVEWRSAWDYYSIKVTLILFVLMPLFNFFNLWDSYLSHNLYTGNTSGGSIYFSDSVYKQLPTSMKSYSVEENGQRSINIKYWCMMDLGVPAYPEYRNFEAAKNSLYKYSSDSSEIYLVYEPKLKMGQ